MLFTHYDQLYDITLHKPVILTYILLRPVNVYFTSENNAIVCVDKQTLPSGIAFYFKFKYD